MLIEKQILLANKTSYHIGGPATLYAAPKTLEEVLSALSVCSHEQLPLFILGKGSNLLISDEGFPGMVLDLTLFNAISIAGGLLTAQGGASLTKVVMQAVNANLQGLEELAGIPGTIGGGLLMNAGAYNQTISDQLSSVTWYNAKSQEVVTSLKEELSFGYRTSSFRQEKALILEATWHLQASDGDVLRQTVRTIQEKRRTTQPLHLPSCGSVFKRPPGNYAGALIEAAGLKGTQIGGAQISEQHANFIVNRGNASAQDVRALISLAREKVFQQSKILLEPEVIFVGPFSAPLWAPNQLEE